MKTLNEIELYNVGKLTRATIADGKFLTSNTLYPLSANDFTLLSAIADYTFNVNESASFFENFSDDANDGIKNWQDTYAMYNTSADAWNQTHDTVEDKKENWDSVYDIVNDNSGKWDGIVASAESGYAASAFIANGNMNLENVEHSYLRYCGDGTDSYNPTSYTRYNLHIENNSMVQIPNTYERSDYDEYAQDCSFAMEGSNPNGKYYYYSDNTSAKDCSFVIGQLSLNAAADRKTFAIVDRIDSNVSTRSFLLLSAHPTVENRDSIVMGTNELGHSNSDCYNERSIVLGLRANNSNTDSYIAGNHSLKGIHRGVALGTSIGVDKTNGSLWNSSYTVNSFTSQNNLISKRTYNDPSSVTEYINRRYNNMLIEGRFRDGSTSIILNNEKCFETGQAKNASNIRYLSNSIISIKNNNKTEELSESTESLSDIILLRPAVAKNDSDINLGCSFISVTGNSRMYSFSSSMILHANSKPVTNIGAWLSASESTDISYGSENLTVGKQYKTHYTGKILAVAKYTKLESFSSSMDVVGNSCIVSNGNSINVGNKIYRTSDRNFITVGNTAGMFLNKTYTGESAKGRNSISVGTQINFDGSYNSLMVGQNGHSSSFNTISVGIKGGYGYYNDKSTATNKWERTRDDAKDYQNPQANVNSLVLIDRTGNLDNGKRGSLKLVRPDGFRESLIVCQDKKYYAFPTLESTVTITDNPAKLTSSLRNSFIVINGALPRYYSNFKRNFSACSFYLVGTTGGYSHAGQNNTLFFIEDSEGSSRYTLSNDNLMFIGKPSKSAVMFDITKYDIDWTSETTFGNALIVGSHSNTSYGARCVAVGKDNEIRYRVGTHCEDGPDGRSGAYPISTHFMVGDTCKIETSPGSRYFICGSDIKPGSKYYGPNFVKATDWYEPTTTQLIFGSKFFRSKIKDTTSNEHKGLYLGVKGKIDGDTDHEGNICLASVGLILSDVNGPFCVISPQTAAGDSRYKTACQDELIGTLVPRYLRFRKNGKWYSIRKYTYQGHTGYAAMEYA